MFIFNNMLITTTATKGETITGTVNVHIDDTGTYCFGFGYYGDKGWKYTYTAAESIGAGTDVQKTINLTIRTDESLGWKVVWFAVLKWNETNSTWETIDEIYNACLRVVG